jgi:hypothetical protein
VNSEEELAGLQRLFEVCGRHGLSLKTLPSEGSPPTPAELFLGQPFDPILAALYRKFRGALLGDFQLYAWGSGERQLLDVNDGMRDFQEEPYLSSLLFGQIPMLAYYLATVPSLADARGIQPVVFIDGYEHHRVLPVASNIDEFFMAFSIYLERAVATPEYAVERCIGLHFPTSVPDVIAHDRRLVEALVAGSFKRLMRNDGESREWISKVYDKAEDSD